MEKEGVSKMVKKAIGRIEKPPVEHFKKPGRKLYLVPLLPLAEPQQKGLPKDYSAKLEVYWNKVNLRLDDLGSKIGKVDRIYHELINEGGEKGLKRLKKLNVNSYRIVKRYVDKGAELQATEDMNLVRESMDWIRCLAANLQSEKALSKVSQFYVEAMQKRDEFVAKKIDETLKENDSGIIFIRENNSVKFPSDIEIFRVYPPVLDDIRRYLRDFYSKS